MSDRKERESGRNAENDAENGVRNAKPGAKNGTLDAENGVENGARNAEPGAESVGRAAAAGEETAERNEPAFEAEEFAPDAPEPLDMRYDGAPRRSQKADKDWLDKIWSFFSSVRVGVTLIVLNLIAAALGSAYPQTDAFVTPPGVDFYEEQYGTLGKWNYLLGFADTYTSWWFKTLVVLLGTSIVIASLDRGIPLYKALKRQKTLRPAEFLRRQGLTFEAELPFTPDDDESARRLADRAEQELRKMRYRTSREGPGLLGEKNRWSRWGPYVHHLGLILFLLVVLLRTLPGFTLEEYVSVLEGDTVRAGDTNYYIKNEKFTVEYYSLEEMRGRYREEGRLLPKLFRTETVLYECAAGCGTDKPELRELARGSVEVNRPLEYRGLSVYQFGYEETPQIRRLTVALKDKATGETYGSFTLRTVDPELDYEAGPYKLRLINYYPEFMLDEEGVPTSRTPVQPNAPGYLFLITGPGLPPEGASYLYFPRDIDKERFRQDEVNAAVGTGDKLVIAAESMDDVEIALYTSTLVLRKDLAVPYLLVGGAVAMIGLIMGFYWHHRRIWVRIDGGRFLLGAHTNKNWHGLKRDASKLLDGLGLDSSRIRTAKAGTKKEEQP